MTWNNDYKHGRSKTDLTVLVVHDHTSQCYQDTSNAKKFHPHFLLHGSTHELLTNYSSGRS